MVEFFAGSAQITRQMREAGYPSARLDLLYSTPESGSSMDINTSSGVAPLCLNQLVRRSGRVARRREQFQSAPQSGQDALIGSTSPPKLYIYRQAYIIYILQPT